MKIRLLKQSEILEASTLIGRNYSKKYQKIAINELNAMFVNPVIPPTYIIAEEKKEIIGLCGYIQSWMDYGVYNIFWVNVIPEKQRMGIGKQLVENAIQRIRKLKAELILLTATILNGNTKFYSKNFGFKKILSLKDNSALMSLQINNGN